MKPSRLLTAIPLVFLLVGLPPGALGQEADPPKDTEEAAEQPAPPATETLAPSPNPGEAVVGPVVAPGDEHAPAPATPTIPTTLGSEQEPGLEAMPVSSSAELQLKWAGKLQTDLRFRAARKGVGFLFKREDLPAWFERNEYSSKLKTELPVGVERNENIFKLKLEATYGATIGVADVDFVWLGHPSELDDLSDLSLRGQVDSYYLQAHALYLETTDFLVEGLDLRVGQQLVLWGKGDQFNPTNNVNANDLEDVLLFGEQLANVIVKLDYTPLADWSLSGVLVPIFKPALLPRSAALGLAATDRLPFLDQPLRGRLHAEQGLAQLMGYPTVVSKVTPVLPERSLENMQFSFRLAGTLLEQDVAISYYRGFTDVPVPLRNETNQLTGRICNPYDPNDCIAGIEGMLDTEVFVAFPRMQVAGLNLAGEFDPLGWLSGSISPIGYRLELALIFPEEREMSIFQGPLVFAGAAIPPGEYDYGRGGKRPLVVDDTPFLKWVAGVDYTFSRNFYLNLMWVHGLPDEFGAGDFLHEGYAVRQGGLPDVTPAQSNELLECVVVQGGEKCGERYAVEKYRPRIGDYVVIGLDLKFADDKALLRLFAILDVSGYFEERWSEAAGKRVRKYEPLFGDGFSAILYPELSYNFGNGLDLGLGALLQFGQDFTKFGDPAAGGSLVWTRARYQF